MTHELLFAGFGGQGVLSMGMTLATAALLEEKEVSWMPSYGPEMRGGTANCTVIVSERKISSPIITRFDAVIALNQPSVDKFEKAVKPNGLLLFDSSVIVTPPTRSDISIVPVPVDTAMMELGNPKVRNMVMLGAFLSIQEVVLRESIIKALAEVLPERYHHLLDVNQRALQKGEAFVTEILTPMI